jgi:hypothetical protein
LVVAMACSSISRASAARAIGCPVVAASVAQTASAAQPAVSRLADLSRLDGGDGTVALSAQIRLQPSKH